MRKLLLIILFSTTLFFNPLGNVSADDPLRVGVYENRPLVFTDSKGEVQGIFIDILDHVAESENWTIDYQQCTWSRCLEMIEAGEIDLQVSIAYSAERAERYRFSEETVLLN